MPPALKTDSKIFYSVSDSKTKNLIGLKPVKSAFYAESSNWSGIGD
jgi:hypothetical protein